MQRRLLFLSGGMFLVFCALVLRPVPSATTQNTIDFTGKVEAIFEGDTNDIIFKFSDSDKRPYINRGIERGIVIQHLNAKLGGKTANFKFIDHWTPLDFNQSTPTVAYIETSDGEVLYDAINL